MTERLTFINSTQVCSVLRRAVRHTEPRPLPKVTFALFQGVTFRTERGEMVITRILHGSSIDRQGMLHVGDIIREVNGREVGSDPHHLQELLRDCSGSITLKVLPSYRDAPAPPQVSGGRGGSNTCGAAPIHRRRNETAFSPPDP